MPSQRLDRFLSHATGLTRSQAQRKIRAGAVRIDDTVVTDPGARVAATARVEHDGEIMAAVQPRYLMLHKPAGYVCATRDGLHRTVLELVEPGPPLHVVGRLDIDATGLVLLTDDGAWSHRVTSPRHKVEKVYRAALAEPLSEAGADALRRGIVLRDEPEPCRPAILEKISETEWRITLTEGRYHQVKRMFAAAGSRVVQLHRERIGAVTLDRALAPGAWRPLTDEEIGGFRPRG